MERDGATSRLLAWVGGAVTLLGLLLLLVLAVQRGWLGPLPRVLGGAALALALVGAGAAVHRRPSGHTGGVVLVATGVAALYLDTVAATVRYDYLPTGAGLVTGLLIGVAGLALADRWRAEPLAVAVVAGAAGLGPVLTGLDPVPLVGFLLALQVAATSAQLRRDWTVLPIVAAVPPLVAALVLDLRVVFEGVPAATVVTVSAVTAVSLLVAVLGSWWTRHRRPVAPAPLVVLAGSGLPVLLLAPSLQLPAGPLAGTALCAVLLVLWFVARWNSGLFAPATAAVAGGLAALAGFEATAMALDGAAWAAVLLGEAIVLTGLAVVLRSRAVFWVGTAFRGVGVIVALFSAVPPPVLFGFPAEPFHTGAQANVGALVTGAGVGLLLAAAALSMPWAADRLGLRAARGALLWVLGGLAGLYGVTAATLAVALLVLPSRAGFLAGHVVVTVSWTVLALMLLARGLRAKPLRTAGMSLVGAALAKLVFFDLGALDGVARVAAFLGAGLVLLAAGTRYARMVAEAESLPVETPESGSTDRSSNSGPEWPG